MRVLTTRDQYEAIMGLWAGSNGYEIGRRLGVTPGQVWSAVRRAREVGDPRAVTKVKGAGWWKTGDPRLTEIGRKGGQAGRGDAKRRAPAQRDPVRLQIGRT